MNKVLGHEISAGWVDFIQPHDQINFVPSPHNGPYLHKFRYANQIWILFGNRIPHQAQFENSELKRADLLVRINAIADDKRLQILKMITKEKELNSSEIMDKLNLSQSCLSRHLVQLVATGYLNERWLAGGKHYSINKNFIQETLSMLGGFFQL